MKVVRLSFVEQICNAFSEGLAVEPRNDKRTHGNLIKGLELERAYALGLRDGGIMRVRKTRLDAGTGLYQ